MEALLTRIRAQEAPSPLSVTVQTELVTNGFNSLVATAQRDQIFQINANGVALFFKLAQFETGIVGGELAVEKAIRSRFDITSPDFIGFRLSKIPLGEIPPLAPGEIIFEDIKYDLDPDFALEVGKRRCINHLLFGGSHSAARNLIADVCYHLGVPDETILQEYRTLFADAELMAFFIDERYAAEGLGDTPPAGMCRVDTAKYPYVVEAAGVNLIILLHEATKGLLEVVAMRGLPGALMDSEAPEGERKAAKQLRHAVLAQADKVQFEAWDLRLGIQFWEDLFGKEITPQILNDFRDLVELPPQEFFKKLPYLPGL